MSTAVALTIAGSDCSGGAGIQADLKTFSALGVYGASVIVALTAQNTQGVQAVLPVEPAFVARQIESVMADLPVGAVKIGMLANAQLIATVVEALARWRPPLVVLDPVMVAKSGHRLLAADALGMLRDRLVPMATLLTPNLPEAADLLGEPEIGTRDAMPALADRLRARGARAVLLKGGHLDEAESPDLLVTDRGRVWLEGERVDTPHTHGSGCSYAAAITALLARGLPLEDAVREAKGWLAHAIRAGVALQIGQGRGPVHHFWDVWPRLETDR